MKKLDAMTLIKEGGSQHTIGLGPRLVRTTFPCVPHTMWLLEAAGLGILTLIGLSQPIPLAPVTCCERS